VFKAGKEVLKWDLENSMPMSGKAAAKLRKLIRQLVEEGKL